MNKLIFTAYLLATVFLFSCKKNEAPLPDYTHWPVVDVSGDQQASVGENIRITVSWPYSSGCDVLEKFNTKKEGNLYIITALGYYTNTICTQDVGIKTKEYIFSVNYPGTYDLDFVNPDGTVITHTVIVQ
jgi:hypothetical protein